MHQRLRTGGFTFIEVLIAVAIIGILAATAVPSFLQARLRSKVAQAQEDEYSVAATFELYVTDYNVHPWQNPNIGDTWNVWTYQPCVALISQITGLTAPEPYTSSLMMDPLQEGSEEMSGWPPFRPDGSYILDRQQRDFEILFPDRPSTMWGIGSIGPDQTALETLAGPWSDLHDGPTNGTISPPAISGGCTHKGNA